MKAWFCLSTRSPSSVGCVALSAICLYAIAVLFWTSDLISVNRRLWSVCYEMSQQQLMFGSTPAAPVQKSFVSIEPRAEEDADLRQVSTVGLQRPSKVFLTIGVPSIRRINGPTYLLQTLTSLVDSLSDAQKSNVTVLIFLADLDANYNNQSLQAILQAFPDHVKSGLFQIIRVSPDYYPPLVGLKRNFGDAPERVRWRSKQVADFSLLFAYAANLSHYYLQIEDDVESSRGFVHVIRSYIDERDRAQSAKDKNWAVLEFSELGFIGKLFKSSDLDRLARYMKLFYAEQPVDWLMRYFRLSMGQHEIYLRKPSLFQHFGVKSSFNHKKNNNLKDSFFDDGHSNQQWANAVYPTATVVSTMPFNGKNSPEMAYNSGSRFFWATRVRAGDTFSILFEANDIHLSRVAVVTGNAENPKDILESGSVYISPEIVSFDSKVGTASCNKRVQVAQFRDGRAEATTLSNYNFTIRCIQLVVEADQEHWALFKRVAVFA